MTGVGFEPTTYGLKVLPGLEPARFFQDNTGQHVHHLGALVWAHMGLVPLYVPLPWKRAERQRSDTVSWGLNDFEAKHNRDDRSDPWPNPGSVLP